MTDSDKWVGPQNDLHSPLKKTLARDDIVLFRRWPRGSQAACQAVNIDSAVVLLVRDTPG